MLKSKRQKWSKDLVITAIQERVAKGLPINSGTVQDDDHVLYSAAIRYFGTWSAAVEAAGFSYDDVRLNEVWSKDLIITTIQERVAKGLPINLGAVQADDHVLYSAAIRYFGTWSAAVEASGFSYDDVRLNEVWSNDLVVAAIQERVARGLPINSGTVQADDRALYGAAHKYIGTWSAAVEASGFSYDEVRLNQKWSKDLMITAIQERVAKGLPINATYVNDNNSALYRAARRYFGTWKAAVEAAGFPYKEVKKSTIRR